jgi:nucleotide-binding universal stress UspA family protein
MEVEAEKAMHLFSKRRKTMFQRILVPLDGSHRAERAIPVASRIARAFGSSVIMLYVVAPPVSSGKFRVPEEYPKVGTDEELAEATEYLKILAQSDEFSGIKTEAQTLVGAVASTILSATQSLQADLVVLCSHGYTGFQHWRLGSVAEKVIRHAPISVVVLRDRGPDPATAAGEPVRALVSLDGSTLSEAILEPVATLISGLAKATSQHGALQLMRVVDIPSGYGRFRSTVDAHEDAGMREGARQEYEQYMEAVAKRFSEGTLSKHDLTVTTLVATDRDVAEVIVRRAEQEKVDFIAMATHGYGGLQHWALGSITERVLHATKLPLFITRPMKAGHS